MWAINPEPEAIRNRKRGFQTALALLLFLASLNGAAQSQPAYILQAHWIFDGERMHENQAVQIAGSRIVAIGSLADLAAERVPVFNLGEASLLPGFIELHAHITLRNVPVDVVLRHGVTTARDLGGPVQPTRGGVGELRLLSSGPILTVPGGYPLTTMGAQSGALVVNSIEQARDSVQELASSGVATIKVALEPGGEPGAPWSGSHEHSAHHVDAGGHPGSGAKPGEWPMFDLPTLAAIVEQAHHLKLDVIAHIGETQGALLALEAGVDQWAHMPCNELPDSLLARAAEQHVTVVSTTDTLARCDGVLSNLKRFMTQGGKVVYGAELAHNDIPWGIDARELEYLVQSGMSPTGALQAATGNAGPLTGVPMLGTLQAGAPADLIAIPGNVLTSFKALEYPQLVISGGKVVVNDTGITL